MLQPKHNRPDTPLAETPQPRPIAKHVAEGVVVPTKNKKEEFTYLTKKEKGGN